LEYQMKILRYATAAVTTLMSLMNLPFAFGDGVSPSIGWLVTLMGVAGILAAVALLRQVPWAPWAVTAIGVVNLLGGVLALALDRDGAVTGIVVSALITALGLACLRQSAGGRPEPAPRLRS
jgi:hypothetical protein